MRTFFATALCACLALLVPGTAVAQGVTVPAPMAVDMVHDAARGRVYISSGNGEVLRYDIASASFLPPVVIGGQPSGMDLSPNGDELAVADRSSDASNLWVNVIDLTSLRSRRLTMRKAFYEGGSWTVAYTQNGNLLVSSMFNGSGWTPLRRVNAFTHKVYQLGEVRQNTMLRASADRLTIAFAESNSSDGPWGLYDVPTRRMVRRQWYENGTSWFNYEIATDASGGQFAIPTYGGTFVYDADYRKVATIGVYAGGQPVGVVYHPTQPLAYFPWAQSGQVRVYDMRTFQQVGAFETGYTFSHPGNGAFQPGRIRISSDGGLLMVRVGNGVRLISTTGVRSRKSLR